MVWRRIIALWGCFWSLSVFAQPVTLTAVTPQPYATWQLNFVTAQTVTVHQFMLNNPARWVIDITGANSLQNQVTAAALFNTPIKKIRSNASSPQTLRIVLDLKPATPPHAIRALFKQKAHASSPAVTAAPKLAKIIVVIDPGHGGKDPGATGVKKIHEKDVVLSISKKLQKLINQQPGFKAVLTRDGDYYLTLRQRLAIARKNQAELFIAIHADAYPDPLAHGVSVFALSQRGATSEAARWLAARENQSELMGGVDLTDKGDMLRSVLINLSQTATIQASVLIGQNLLDNIAHFAHLHHQYIEQAAFVVLKSPDIPSLLVETGFLSNSQEEAKLSNPSYQYSLANAITLGIKQYYLKHHS